MRLFDRIANGYTTRRDAWLTAALLTLALWLGNLMGLRRGGQR